MLTRNAAIYSGSDFIRGADVRIRDGRIAETGASAVLTRRSPERRMTGVAAGEAE